MRLPFRAFEVFRIGTANMNLDEDVVRARQLDHLDILDFNSGANVHDSLLHGD